MANALNGVKTKGINIHPINQADGLEKTYIGKTFRNGRVS